MTQRVLARLALVLAFLALPACTSSHEGGDDSGSIDLGACDVTSDCVVVSVSCCGTCGTATRGDAIAIHQARVRDHAAAACGDDAACPACAGVQDPNLVATCRAGRCEVVDLLAEPLTACTADTECRLRPHDCCSCGGDVSEAGLVAIRRDDESALMELVCDEGPSSGCPECEPTYPDGVTARCDTGRCRVAR